MGFIRARTDEQKEVRYAEIIAAAKRLFDGMGYDEITLASIAKEAEFTRSNLYKYYKTKDEIFLEIIIGYMAAWREDLQQSFQGKEFSINEFAHIMARSYREHEKLLDSLTVLFVFIEKNVSLENLTEFKRGLKQEMEALVEMLCQAMPALSPQQALEFIIMQVAAANGLYPMTTLTEKQQQAANDSGLGDLHGSFEIRLEHILAGYLKGILEAETI